VEEIRCPLCGGEAVVATDREAWFDSPTKPVILGHYPSTRAVLNGTDVRHVLSDYCLGSNLSRALAEWVAADRRAGVHLRAHP
jgi:hypothetical protein